MFRREFIKNSTTLSLAVCTCGVGFSSCSAFTGISKVPEAPDGSFELVGERIVVNLDKIPHLREAGGSIKFTINQGHTELLKLLIARKKDGSFLAVQNQCTHGQRELEYIPEENMIRCVSMGHSKYNMQGEVIKGPAPGPVSLYEASQEQNSLIIELG